MATYSQLANKRMKTTKESTKLEINEYFPSVSKIEFKGNTAPAEEVLCYRYYNQNERIHGKTMEEWMRVALPITIFKLIGSELSGKANLPKVWDDRNTSSDNYKQLFKAAFEFCSKMGIKYYTLFDRDIFLELENSEDSTLMMDEIVEYIQELQQRYNVRPLWITPDLFSHQRYVSGSGTSNDSSVTICAAQQIKKCLEIAQKLNSENFVVFSFHEGYNFILNTDIQREMKNYARLLKMIYEYKERQGLRLQLLFCPRRVISPECHDSYPNYENCWKFKHVPNNPYFWDFSSSLCFLKHYNLDKFYKICVEPGHEFYLCNSYNAVGSVELQEEFINDNFKPLLFMKKIMEQGGILPVGINMKFLPKKDSTDVKDVFATFINCIDSLARAVRISTKMINDPIFSKIIQQKYASFYNGIGNRITNGEANLEECEEQAKKYQNQNVEQTSGKYEQWKNIVMNFINNNT